MFDSLSDKLGNIFTGLTGKGRLSENDVTAAMREIRVALLEADVALPIVKQFVDNVREQAVGQDIVKSVSPGQQVVKIVNDALVELLGGEHSELGVLKAPAPAVMMMVGLQGSGKTTSSAKVAKFLSEKQNKKLLMASLDVARPAAQEQLAQLGTQTNIDTLPIISGQDPLAITDRALSEAKKGGYDVLILDTAGRLSIDEELMAEVSAVKKKAAPAETMLVVDAMTGQDAVVTGEKFHAALGLTGIMLTRIDGDARGGAAMSMRAVTGQPIKLLGTGENIDALESFHPDRIASRILGMGDVVSLVEKAAETIDKAEAEKMAAKLKKGKFDFNDMLAQFKQVSNMGGMGAIMKMLPGLSGMTKMLEESGEAKDMLKKQEAMILSMTLEERAKPQLLNASRKKRIAAGSGSTVQELNKLVKQHQQMEKMMKRMKKMGMGGMMNQMKGLMGGKDAAMMDQLENMSEEDIQAAMEQEQQGGALGPNPFASGGLPSGLQGGLPNGLPGGFPGLPGASSPMGGLDPTGMPTKRGGTKKNRKKGKRK